MKIYCKYKIYVLTLESSNKNVNSKYLFKDNEIITREIYDITTQQYLNELSCDIPPYKQRIFNINTHDRNVEIIEGSVVFQIKKDEPLLLYNYINSFSFDDEYYFRSLEHFHFFEDYELAYFHNFLEQKQYELFNFCGIAKEFRYRWNGEYQLKSQVFLNNGKFEGEYKEFNKFGYLIYSCNYVNGEKHGNEIFLKVFGRNYETIINKINFYELGRKIAEQVFHQTAEKKILIDKKFDENNKIIDYIRYNKEGHEVERRYYGYGIRVNKPSY